MKQTVPNNKKKSIRRIGRVTEVVLSVVCLFLFALSMSLVTGLPIYFLRDWIPSLDQSQLILFFSAYLLLLPVAFLGARFSLQLLNQVEALAGKRVPFRRRLKKLRRKEKQLNRYPSPRTAKTEKAGRLEANTSLHNRKIFSSTFIGEPRFFKEV